ncbi:MAG: hypothetical protein AB7Q81_24525 [Gammaproteobacteria bacterium]
MAHDIDDLREHLFETLAALRDKENPMDIERAHAVCAVATQVIDSAKVEVAFLKECGGKGSGFLLEQPKQPGQPRPPRLVRS